MWLYSEQRTSRDEERSEREQHPTMETYERVLNNGVVVDVSSGEYDSYTTDARAAAVPSKRRRKK